MARGRKKPKRKSHASTEQTHSPHALHSLISALRSPEGLKAANLKQLYTILVYLSLNEPRSLSNYESSLSSPDGVLDVCGVKLRSKDIRDLSDILFKELSGRFSKLLSALHHVSDGLAMRQSILHTDIEDTVQELTLLLRCCLVILILIGFDQNLLIEKSQFLLSILSRLISIELSSGNDKSSLIFTKLVSSGCASITGGCTTSVSEEYVTSIYLSELSDSSYAGIRAVLEVFADELLVHKLLREYFMLIDSASSRNEMLFRCHFGHGDIGSVLEVICAHFILSASDGQGFENFLDRLFWCHGEDFRIPEMSLPAALSLLLNPIMLSAPKMFLAYLLSLVSEAIGICKPSETMRPDLRLINFYLTAFERSVVLYNGLMSTLHVHGHPFAVNGPFVESHLLGNCQQTFESFLQPATRDKLYHLIAKSNKSFDSYLSKISLRTNSDMVSAAFAYMEENIGIFDGPYQYDVLSILTNIILRGSSDIVDDTVLLKNGEISSQEIYLLASILKLMSSSMLQVIWHVGHLRYSGCLNSLEDDSSCKEYEAIADILGCFEQFGVRLPIQKFLHEIMQSHPTKHKKSKWMLFHFAGLFSLSYVKGIKFLFKDCLFTIMTLLNLLILEEGNLSALESLFSSRSECYPNSSDKIDRVLFAQKCTPVVSSKIQKIQETYLRTRSLISFHKGKEAAETSEYVPVVDDLDPVVTNNIVEHTEETCNGEIFLKTILGKHCKKLSELDDLADFIECTPGKDYSRWLRDRQKFRVWKRNKMMTSKLKKKKKTWNYVKGS